MRRCARTGNRRRLVGVCRLPALSRSEAWAAIVRHPIARTSGRQFGLGPRSPSRGLCGMLPSRNRQSRGL
eukprot:4580133-Heterocapsa_arctica.AAC.1